MKKLEKNLEQQKLNPTAATDKKEKGDDEEELTPNVNRFPIYVLPH